MATVFADEIYDHLDPISQMVEPFQCPVLDFLGLIPDETMLNAEQSRIFMIDLIMRNEPYVKIHEVIGRIFPSIDQELINRIKDAHAYSEALGEAISVEIDGDFCYNSTTGQVISDCTITIRKNPNMSESTIMNTILTKIAKGVFFPSSLSSDELARVKDLAEILEAKVDNKSRRGSNYWCKIIQSAILEKITTNQWRIRSSEAMLSLMALIDDIVHDRLSNWHLSKINLIHVKAIARNNKPIYKIAEL